jgi:hypothetical protein
VAKALRRTRVPLAAYYGITIVVPLFNGTGSTERAFLEHLIFVSVFPLTLVGLTAMLSRLLRTGFAFARSRGPLASTSKGPGPFRRSPIGELNASVPRPLGR